MRIVGKRKGQNNQRQRHRKTERQDRQDKTKQENESYDMPFTLRNPAHIVFNVNSVRVAQLNKTPLAVSVLDKYSVFNSHSSD